MGAVESLVQVVLVFRRDGRCEVKPYGDGFLLVTHRDGATGFRHWRLDGGVGEITTSGDNEVATVRVRRAAGGAVELPDPAVVDETGGALRARMAWPAPVVARVETRAETSRHELRLDGGAPARWVRLGPSAWVATTADSALARVVVEAPLVPTERVAIRIPAVPVTATRQAGFVRVSWDGRGTDLREARRGNAELVLDPDGVATALEVHDVEEGAPLRPIAGEPPGALWLDCPCDVTATRWEAEDGTSVGVHFGPPGPERWLRLESGVAVGASAEGELRALVVPLVDEDPRAHRGMFGGRAGMSPHDPFAALTELAESGAGPLTVYGLAGEEGYGRLLALHVMLRPLSGWSSSSEALRRRDDGSIAVALAVNHAAGAGDGWTQFGTADAAMPEPDSAAIRAGAAHTIELRLIREGEAWKLGTDLLAVLEQRLGTVDELVRPLSEQSS